MSRKPTKKTSTSKTKAPKAVKVEAAQDAPAPTTTPKKSGSTPGSLARRKRVLLDELRSEVVTPARQVEIRHILDTELADVPNLSTQELSRLGN